MKAGPKAKPSVRALPTTSVAGSPGAAWASWCARWLRVPKGAGAGGPFRPRPWQVEIVDRLLEPATRQAVLVCGRGNGKSGMAAALGLHHLVEGGEGATVAVVATDERAAERILKSAARMTETSPSLAKRVTGYANRLVYQRTGSELIVLPAEARRIEGGDFSLAIVDELGLVERDVWESTLLSLKREGARALGIGTPSPVAWQERAPLWDLLTEARRGEQNSLRAIEYGSDATHAPECEHCWESANPGLDDILAREHLASSLPPRTREHEFRRARLAQWPTADSEGWLPPGAWDAVAAAGAVPDGADVVLALDGSFSQDSTAVVAVSIGPVPHIAVVGLWSAPRDDPDWRVNVLEVEDVIAAAARQWRVREIIADPFRWTRSLQVLAAQGLPVVEFPQTAARMSPATTGLREAVINKTVTQSGDPRLAEHVGNAVLRDDARGVRLTKPSKHSLRRIDSAVCAVMGHARATHYANALQPRRRGYSYR